MKTNILLSMVMASTVALASSTAQAQAQSQSQSQYPATTVGRSYSAFPGKNEISTQLGFQASLGGQTPGGFKIFLDYSRQMNNLVWLNFKFNPTFGVGSASGVCYDRFGNPYNCGVAGFDGYGYAIDILGGVKLKWLLSKYHLLPYADIDAGVVPVFARPGNDDGAAVVLYTGGGLKYFVTPRVGVGGEFNFTFGPGFYQGHTEFYRAFNMGIGAEFIL